MDGEDTTILSFLSDVVGAGPTHLDAHTHNTRAIHVRHTTYSGSDMHIHTSAGMSIHARDHYLSRLILDVCDYQTVTTYVTTYGPIRSRLMRIEWVRCLNPIALWGPGVAPLPDDGTPMRGALLGLPRRVKNPAFYKTS